jgi:hypothetical protein
MHTLSPKFGIALSAVGDRLHYPEEHPSQLTRAKVSPAMYLAGATGACNGKTRDDGHPAAALPP